MSSSPSAIRASIIGRDDDIEALESTLQRPDVRLVTLTGTGGVGKTRLAWEIFQRASLTNPGRVWFVPLADVRHSELVAATIAAELGIRDLVAGETFDRIVERLGAEPALLILDNVEHLIDCGPTLGQLVQHAPGTTLLLTSRQPLQLQVEHEFPLRPLPTGADSTGTSPAEQLFVLRARESSYGFAVTDDNRQAIRQIAQRLGGIPLAIELAAPWVKMLPPRQLHENLDRQLDVLVRGPKDLPRRQQTMRSAIAWSYHLLSPREQEIYRQLSVFHGPFTLSDAEGVVATAGDASADPWDDLEILETISSLVTKNLVQVEDDPVDAAEPEYRLLEIIRAYGWELLCDTGSSVAVRNRHLSHFLALAERWTGELGGAQRELRLAQFDREYRNFRAALEWSAESHDLASGLRLLAALWRYWDWRGLHAEGARWCDSILELEGSVDPVLRSNALYAGAAIAFMQARYDRSVALAEACLTLADESGDPHAIARGLLALGNTTYDRGDLARSGEVYARSLDHARTAGEPIALQVALVNLGFVRYQQEAFDDAARLFDEAISMTATVGQESATAWAEVGLAQVEFRQGAVARAAERLRDVIDRQCRADTGQLGAALLALAVLERSQGDVPSALALARDSLANRVAREERAFITDSLAEVGAILLEGGLLDEGVGLLAAADNQRRLIGYGLPALERTAHRKALDLALRTMGSDRFERAWATGERTAIADAVEQAMSIELPITSTKATEARIERPHGLTPREMDVLQLIVDGKTDREIAQALSISSGTASRHVANILHKLELRTRSAAAAWYIRNIGS